MELWHPLAQPAVNDAYAEHPSAQPAPAVFPTGDLFRQALIQYSVAARPVPMPVLPTPQSAPAVPVAPRPTVNIIPAESASIFSMVHGYLRKRNPRA